MNSPENTLIKNISVDMYSSLYIYIYICTPYYCI